MAKIGKTGYNGSGTVGSGGEYVLNEKYTMVQPKLAVVVSMS